MNKLKKSKTLKFILCFLTIISVIAMVMPMQQGIEGVYQIILGKIAILILAVIIIIVFAYKIYINKKAEKDDKICLFIITIIVLFCIYRISFSAMGLAEGIQTVHCDDYKVDYHNVYVAHDNYLLDFEADGQKGSVYITRDMYNRLKHSDKEIIVTYYPYIDIVDEIIFVE